MIVYAVDACSKTNETDSQTTTQTDNQSSSIPTIYPIINENNTNIQMNILTQPKNEDSDLASHKQPTFNPYLAPSSTTSAPSVDTPPPYTAAIGVPNIDEPPPYQWIWFEWFFFKIKNKINWKFRIKKKISFF